METPPRWETAAAEYRLTQKHHLALAGKSARSKKLKWVEDATKLLRAEIATWRYRPQMVAPDIEVAWIIHSHIAWKGEDINEENLYVFLPETDPARIMEAEAEGPETRSALPTETIRTLHNLLIQLEKFGCDIQSETFSNNWVCPSKGSTKGKNSMPKGIKPAEKAVKPQTKKVEKTKKPKNEKKNKMLASFFDLKESR